MPPKSGSLASKCCDQLAAERRAQDIGNGQHRRGAGVFARRLARQFGERSRGAGHGSSLSSSGPAMTRPPPSRATRTGARCAKRQAANTSGWEKTRRTSGANGSRNSRASSLSISIERREIGAERGELRRPRLERGERAARLGHSQAARSAPARRVGRPARRANRTTDRASRHASSARNPKPAPPPFQLS